MSAREGILPNASRIAEPSERKRGKKLPEPHSARTTERQRHNFKKPLP